MCLTENFLLGIVYLATTNGKQLVLSSTHVFINASGVILVSQLVSMSANSRRVMQALGDEWSGE